VEGHTRRTVSGMLIAAALVAVGFCSIAVAKPGRVEQTGVFALLGGTPKIVSKFWIDHPNGLSATLKVRQFATDGKTPVLDYDVDMEHVMHMIIVRDDFATFVHLHPDLDTQTGTFWQDFTKEPNHRYYVYADSTPHGIGQQVFRFTLDSAGPVANSQPALTPSARTVSTGPYMVQLSKTTIPADRPRNLHVVVLENGEPATDLGPYLGEAAHAVFINTATLAYVHVHPTVRNKSGKKSEKMNMNAEMGGGGKAGPFMQMAVPALPAGTYKLWIQFLGGANNLYSAAFTILAR
jgi:hypothetical protein